MGCGPAGHTHTQGDEQVLKIMRCGHAVNQHGGLGARRQYRHQMMRRRLCWCRGKGVSQQDLAGTTDMPGSSQPPRTQRMSDRIVPARCAAVAVDFVLWTLSCEPCCYLNKLKQLSSVCTLLQPHLCRPRCPCTAGPMVWSLPPLTPACSHTMHHTASDHPQQQMQQAWQQQQQQ
jgi:hypothetical protein